MRNAHKYSRKYFLYEKNSTHTFSGNVQLRLRVASVRVHRPTYGRDTSISTYRFWRSINF